MNLHSDCSLPQIEASQCRLKPEPISNFAGLFTVVVVIRWLRPFLQSSHRSLDVISRLEDHWVTGDSQISGSLFCGDVDQWVIVCQVLLFWLFWISPLSGYSLHHRIEVSQFRLKPEQTLNFRGLIAAVIIIRWLYPILRSSLRCLDVISRLEDHWVIGDSQISGSLFCGDVDQWVIVCQVLFFWFFWISPLLG